MLDIDIYLMLVLSTISLDCGQYCQVSDSYSEAVYHAILCTSLYSWTTCCASFL